MAVPKKRTSSSKRNMRRSHHSLKDQANSTCKACGEVIRPHHVCSACGARPQAKK